MQLPPRTSDRAFIGKVICLFAVAGATVMGGCVQNESETAGSTPIDNLVGDRSFDFGDVSLDGPVTLTHEFRLRNSGRRQLDVVKVSSSCGCTIGNIVKKSIGPGEDLVVASELHLTSRGTRREKIRVLFEDTSVLALELSGTGIREQELFASTHGVDLVNRDRGTILLVAFSESPGEAPPAVRVSTPRGVEAEVGAWIAVAPEADGVARRFHCRVDVRRNDNATSSTRAESGKIRVEVDSWGELDFFTDGLAW